MAEQDSVIAAPEQLSVHSISSFKSAFDAGWSDSICVDLSKTEQIDSCGVQLLIAASRRASMNNGRLYLKGASDSLRESIKKIGIEGELEILN